MDRGVVFFQHGPAIDKRILVFAQDGRRVLRHRSHRRHLPLHPEVLRQGHPGGRREGLITAP